MTRVIEVYYAYVTPQSFRVSHPSFYISFPLSHPHVILLLPQVLNSSLLRHDFTMKPKGRKPPSPQWNPISIEVRCPQNKNTTRLYKLGAECIKSRRERKTMATPSPGGTLVSVQGTQISRTGESPKTSDSLQDWS